jgi:hypothetical protein
MTFRKRPPSDPPLSMALAGWGLAGLLLGGGSLQAGTTGAAFLKPNPSVRSQALGNVTPAAQGAQAVGANPAMVDPASSKGELYTSFFQTWEESNNAQMAYAHNLNSRLAWGLSVAVSDSGSSEGTDLHGQPTGQTATSQNGTLTGALAKEMKRGVRVGAAARVFQSTLADNQSDLGWSADLGATAQSKHFLLGVSAHQLGPGLTYVEQRDPLPSSIKVGLAWTSGPISVMGGYHTSLADDESEGAIGMEYRLKILAFRAGLKNQFGEDEDLAQTSASETAFLDNTTLGFGLSLPNNLKLDYAFSQTAPDWGASHSAALTWAWGKRPVPPKPPRKLAPRTGPKPSSPSKNPAPPRQKLKQ